MSNTRSAPRGSFFCAGAVVAFNYTLDGSAPAYSSSMYESAGIREGGETLTITSTTTIRWFAVDASGDAERNYDPSRGNANRKTIRITP